MFVAWGASILGCLPGDCEPDGPGGAFVLPIAIFFAVLTALIVYPIMFGLRSVLGSVPAIIIVTVCFVAAITGMFYRPEIDSSYANVFVTSMAFIGLPWVIGALAGFWVLNHKQSANA